MFLNLPMVPGIFWWSHVDHLHPAPQAKWLLIVSTGTNLLRHSFFPWCMGWPYYSPRMVHYPLSSPSRHRSGPTLSRSPTTPWASSSGCDYSTPYNNDNNNNWETNYKNIHATQGLNTSKEWVHENQCIWLINTWQLIKDKV